MDELFNLHFNSVFLGVLLVMHDSFAAVVMAFVLYHVIPNGTNVGSNTN